MSEITRKQDQPQVGYLTTLEHQDFGILGGYLVVDIQGRPLEFHCTAPVQPSRAQEILYGHSLRPYLLGEQIGGGLVRAAKLKPQVLLIDQVDLGAFRCNDTTAIALLSDIDKSTSMDISGHAISFPFAAQDISFVTTVLESLSQSIDLAEPFQRIHLAIREAQRIGEDDHPMDLPTDSAHAA